MTNNQEIALGDPQAKIRVFIANRPPLAEYQELSSYRPLQAGDIHHIAEQTGNHWRKVFNVYAKFIFELNQPKYTRWQDYRDQELLNASSKTALIFTPPEFSSSAKPVSNIVMGKTYANELGLAQQCQWLSPEFAINPQLQLIICPYFDYRQLSNQKISQLCRLMQQLKTRD